MQRRAGSACGFHRQPTQHLVQQQHLQQQRSQPERDMRLLRQLHSRVHHSAGMDSSNHPKQAQGTCSGELLLLELLV
jgi:hypothetical protein